MADPGAYRLQLVFLLAVLMPGISHGSGATDNLSAVQSHAISADFLRGSDALHTPVSTRAFTPPEASSPAQPFSGLLTLDGDGGPTGIETVADTYQVTHDAQLEVAKLPPFSFAYISDGSALIPLKRQPQRSDHPYWEIVLEPGRTWSDAADMGWSRAAIPFALKEKNQNCTHNGLMTFVYKQDGSISRVAWQIASETCLYLKLNLWGVVRAQYEPVPALSDSAVVAAYRREVAARLPVKSFSALETDYPGLDAGAFRPSGNDDASVYGLVFNGAHYRSECPTRFGPYPFCDVLDLPSYSLAKSVFAGLTYLLLSKRWPELATMPVASLVPECRLADKRWDGVTLAHLVNMTTGNYKSAVFNADEDNDTGVFFTAETHADKIRFSCEAWPHKSAAGSQWVYHTTDTYLLGVAMQNFLKQKLGDGADVHRDLLYPEVFEPLDLSPVLLWTQRTYDDRAQPFTGYGLVFHSDDLARIALALNSASSIGHTLAGTNFESAMFRAGTPLPAPPGRQGLAYSHGFWGVDATGWIGCSTSTWIPFMSGYGGIVVALLPNGGVYYFFTDSNQHGFRKAAVEANKVLNFCKE